MGKSSLEPQILEEIERYTTHFVEPNLGEAVDLAATIPYATSNIICQLLYSKRYDYEDTKFTDAIAGLAECTMLNVKIAMLENLPFASYLLKSTLARENYLVTQVFDPVVQDSIDEHDNSLDPDHPRDVTDRYLIHSHSEEGERSTSFSSKT